MNGYKHQIAIEAAYNAGEWRLSQEVTGPRGGKKWQKIHSTPATGGLLNITLQDGHYKVTYWTNGWPRSYRFDVVNGEMGEAY